VELVPQARKGRHRGLWQRRPRSWRAWSCRASLGASFAWFRRRSGLGANQRSARCRPKRALTLSCPLSLNWRSPHGRWCGIDPFQAGVFCPRLHQRAVPREGLVAEQRLGLWSCHQRLHEQLGDVVMEDSMVAFGVAEFGRRPSVVGCKIGSLGL
jgi:hypothetical protein